MKQFSLLVIAIAAFAAATWVPTSPTATEREGLPYSRQVDQTWEEAAKAFREGAYDRAIELADKVLVGSSRHADALNTKGCALHQLKRYEEALRAFDQAIDEAKTNAVMWGNRARSFYALRRYDEALRDFSQSLELDPKRAEIWLERGFVYFDTSRLDRALADYDKAISLNPQHAGFRANRTRLLRSLGRLDEALKEAEEAVRLDSKNVLAVRERMRALLDAKEYAEAEKMVARLEELAPNDAQVRYDRARWLEVTGRLEEAAVAYGRALELSPNYSAAMRRRAEVLRRLGKVDEAVRDERDYERVTGQLYTPFIDVYSGVPVPSGGPAFEGWPSENLDKASTRDVLWRSDEPALKPDDLPTDVSNLDLDDYQAMARQALEMVRIVYGDLTEDESNRLQAKWAPILDFPTSEALAYFKQLNPLLRRYIEVRAAVVMAAAEFDQSWEQATLAAGLDLPDSTNEALRQASDLRQTLQALRGELTRVVLQIKALGDPPNPYRARKRAKDAFDRALGQRTAPPSASGLEGIWEGYWFADGNEQARAPFMLALVDPIKGMAIPKGHIIAMSNYGPYANYYSRFAWRVLAVKESSPGLYTCGQYDSLYLGDVIKQMRVEGGSLMIQTETQDPKQTLIYRLRKMTDPPGPGPDKCTLADALAMRKKAKVLENTKPPQTGDEIADMKAGIEQHRQAMDLNGRAFVLEGYHRTRLALPLALANFKPKDPTDYFDELEKLVALRGTDAAAFFEKAKAAAEAAVGPVEETPGPAVNPNASRISEIRAQITQTQTRLDKWKAELRAEKDPKRAEQLALNVVATVTDIQEQEALAKSLESGEIVRPRTLWQQLAQAQLIEQMQIEARKPTFFARAEKQLDGLIDLLEGPQRNDMLAMKAKLLSPEARAKTDTEALKQLFRAAHNQVLGQQGAKEAYNEQMINSLEEVKFGAGLSLIVIAPYAATGASPYAGYAGYIGAGYGIGTGYVEGGVVGAAESGLRMVSGTVDVALAATHQYDATGSWTEAGKAAALQLVLRVGLQYSGKRLIQERLQVKNAWNEAVLKTRFKELKEEGRVLTEEYRNASKAFEEMVNKRAIGGDVQAYVTNNAAELARTPEGQRLINAMGAVENSYSTKLVMNEGADRGLIANYNRNLGAFVEQPVIARTQALMKQLGYGDFSMKPIRHGANLAKKGMDNDLAVEEDGWTPTRDGQPVTLLEFQRDLTKCLGQAYRNTTGRSAEHADWRGTTRVDPEAYLDRAVLSINKMREQGLSPAQILRALNPQTADQTAGVNVYKVQRALGRPGVEGVAEACRTLTKELDTKVLQTLNPNSFEFKMFKQLRDVLAQGTTDPVGVQQKVRLVTGRDLNQVAQMLANRFGLAIKGGG